MLSVWSPYPFFHFGLRPFQTTNKPRLKTKHFSKLPWPRPDPWGLCANTLKFSQDLWVGGVLGWL
jgi:hypothetical protein